MPRLEADSHVHEAIKDLEALDPGELVDVLGVSTEALIAAFPGHVYDYIRSTRTVPIEDDGDVDMGAVYNEITRLQDEGFSVYYIDNEHDHQESSS